VRSTEARLNRDITAGRIPAEPRREVIERLVTEIRAPDALPRRGRDWAEMLDQLTRQLADPDGLGGRHYDHPRIHAALMRVLHALDEAHPGGIRRLR
jgi:plasmid stabilization system protein ParE